MMSFGESLLCVGVIPATTAGVAVGIVNTTWGLPWWGLVVVAVSGRLIGFVAAAIGGTVIERVTRRRTTKR